MCQAGGFLLRGDSPLFTLEEIPVLYRLENHWKCRLCDRKTPWNKGAAAKQNGRRKRRFLCPAGKENPAWKFFASVREPRPFHTFVQFFPQIWDLWKALFSCIIRL